MKRVLILFTLGNILLISILYGAHLRQPDTTCYIDAARRIVGLPADGDCGYRLLKPLPVLFAGVWERVTGVNPMYGLFAQNILFYMLGSFLFFEIVRLVFNDESQALIAAFMFGTAPPFLVFGLAYLTDMMGWFWAFFGMYLALRFTRRAFFIGMVLGIGLLYKESALGGLIFFSAYTLFDHKAFIIEKLKRLGMAALGFVIPIGISTVAVYAFMGYTFFDWFAFAWSKPFGDEYSIFYFVKNAAATLYVYWVLFAVGAYALFRRHREGVLSPDTLRFISASGATVVLWFVWSYPAARIFYLSAPFLMAVASYGACVLGRRRGFALVFCAAIFHYALVWALFNGYGSPMTLLGAVILYGIVFFILIAGIFRAGLSFVALGAVVVFFEVGLRIAGYSGETIERDAKTGLMTLIPHSRFSFRKECLTQEVHVNAAGFNDFEFVRHKEPGVFRIAILGDSYVEALHVSREAAFHNRLEKMLNEAFRGSPRFEVYAFGMSGNGTLSNYLYLTKYALQYKPDLVINAFLVGNDFRNDSAALSVASGLTLPTVFPVWNDTGRLDMAAIETYTRHKIANPVVVGVKKIASRSALVMWLYPKYYAAKARITNLVHGVTPPVIDSGGAAHELIVDDQVFLKEYPPVWRDAWITEEKLLLLMKQAAEDAGGHFMLISLTEGFRVHPSLMRSKGFTADALTYIDFEKPERLLKEIAARRGISYLPLMPFFKDHADRLTIFSCDGHWNDYGHALAAEALFDFLKINVQTKHPAIGTTSK